MDKVNKILCPHCGEEIKRVEYGNGWLWVCCGKVVHNLSRLDEPKKIHAEDDSQTTDKKA